MSNWATESRGFEAFDGNLCSNESLSQLDFYILA